jgi:hypothetical protein
MGNSSLTGPKSNIGKNLGVLSQKNIEPKNMPVSNVQFQPSGF